MNVADIKEQLEDIESRIANYQRMLGDGVIDDADMYALEQFIMKRDELTAMLAKETVTNNNTVNNKSRKLAGASVGNHITPTEEDLLTYADMNDYNQLYETQYKPVDFTISSDAEQQKFCKAYGKALEAAGLNTIDQDLTTMTLFNRYGEMRSDPEPAGPEYIFFTRPDCCFNAANVTAVDYFSYIANSYIGRYCMQMLQYPEMTQTKHWMDGLEANNNTDSLLTKVTGLYKRQQKRNVNLDVNLGYHPIEDVNKGVFELNPLLSNCCKSFSGAKELSLTTMETETDFVGNSLHYANGYEGSFSKGSVDITFDDIMGTPVWQYFFIWIQYIHHATKGTITPWMKYVRERVIDYTCSIYYFKLGPDGKTIKRWAKWTGCYPTQTSLDSLNFTKNPGSKADSAREVSMQYNYNMYSPMDPKVFTDFNTLNFHRAFTPSDIVKMKDTISGTSTWDASSSGDSGSYNNVDSPNLRDYTKYIVDASYYQNSERTTDRIIREETVGDQYKNLSLRNPLRRNAMFDLKFLEDVARYSDKIETIDQRINRVITPHYTTPIIVGNKLIFV